MKRHYCTLGHPHPTRPGAQDCDRATAPVREPRTGLALSGETRVVDPVTGGEKGSKLSQLTAVHAGALLEVGKVAGFGAEKYERFNFLKGYRWSLSTDAKARHFLAWVGGEDLDPESGLYHLAHDAWHSLALLAFQLEGLGTDDRWKRP